MAKYSMELRKVCDYYTREEVENWFKNYELSDFLRPDEIESIETANIWSKDRLAKKIVDHYFMREIGFETPGLFKHYALITMQEIMEEKLPLIYSSSIKYDPLVNVDYTEKFERSLEGSANNNGESSSNSSSDSLNINNSTPQTRISKQNLDDGIYASSVNQNESSINDKTTTSNNGSSSSNENYIKNIKGNSGVSATAQKMIEQYRQNIIAIDRDIINELNTLFMGLY